MENDDFARHFQLDITVQGDRCRQVYYESDPSRGIRQKKTIKIWTQQRFLKENVYVQRTQAGEMRVVKQIVRKQNSMPQYLSELQLMGRVSKVINDSCFMCSVCALLMRRYRIQASSSNFTAGFCLQTMSAS